MRNYMSLPLSSNESNLSSNSQNKNPNSYRPYNESFENKMRRFYSFTFTQEDFLEAFTPNSSRKPDFSGKWVKKEINLMDIANGKDKNTTLMIRNIPIKYTDEMLQKELKCFENKYDCLYMPFDYEKNGNKGYAFINFVNPLHILLFYELFHGKSWNYFESKKICELNLANFQGINEIKRHAKNYKGIKKPIFFVVTEEWKNCNIEVPDKYLKTILERYPKMNYIEKKQTQTFIIKSF